MKRIFFIPLAGLLLSLIIGYHVAHAQQKFQVEVVGKGKPVILIHGLYCDGSVWKETIERYRKDYQCHVLTLAGFGGVTAMVQDRFLEAVADDIISYTREQKLTKPVLIGHSMGAFISFNAASKAPGLFSGVLAVDGLPFMAALQNPAATPDNMKPMAENMRSMMASLSPAQVTANQKMYLPSMIKDPQRIDEVIGIAVRCDGATQGQVMYELYTTDLRDRVSSITCPVLLLGAWIGYKDYGATREGTVRAYSSQVSKIRNATVAVSDSAKHFIFYDDPDWFFSKTSAFLSAL